jgi:hypothetical protein
MPEALEISLTQETGKQGLRRTLRLHKTGTSRDDDQAFFFDLIGDTTSPAPLVLDGFVFGIILIAMQLGRPVKVHGRLSRTACFNLAEFQSAWACWKPEKYQRVDIVPDEIIDLPAPEHAPRAISAFSGGVDGTFTAIRHKHKLLGNGSYPLTDVMLLHGFDVPLGKPEAFDLLLQRIRPLVDELGLGMKVIRTNLKEASGQYWEDSFGVQLAACLHNYSHDFNYALMGSGEPYSNIFYPWGSTPATDYLMSGDQMQLVLDGCAYTRTEKIETLRHYPTALKTFKVCWEGSNQERNCGVCEKCIRTKLNLLAVGVSDAPCFDEELDPELILKIRLINDAQLLELKTIYSYVEKRKIAGLWVDNLKRRIDWYINRNNKRSRVERLFRKLSNTL